MELLQALHPVRLVHLLQDLVADERAVAELEDAEVGALGQEEGQISGPKGENENA